MKFFLKFVLLVVLLNGCKDKDVDADWAGGLAGTYNGSGVTVENGYSRTIPNVVCTIERVDNKSVMVIFEGNSIQSKEVYGPLTVTSAKTFEKEFEVKAWNEYLVMKGVLGETVLLLEWESYADSSKGTLNYSGKFSLSK